MYSARCEWLPQLTSAGLTLILVFLSGAMTYSSHSRLEALYRVVELSRARRETRSEILNANLPVMPNLLPSRGWQSSNMIALHPRRVATLHADRQASYARGVCYRLRHDALR